ncbi:hypothetical protein OH77DRAFT_1394190 [Trametes cingulata]|nr:hypothetical protein OH77DRAFT_1394190 [Trametes cingulata]
MEEGEITDGSLLRETKEGYVSLRSCPPDVSGTTYSPALEWPGDTDSPSNLPYSAGPSATVSAACPSPTSSLRLLVQRSTLLRTQGKLALLDGYPEIQIGRDAAPPGSDIPKIRLKEMEVSKLHATIYWDQAHSRWLIVDMGSKHGTFIRPASSAAPSLPADSMSEALVDSRGLRLSAPRVASMPRTLHHLDRLSIGGTTFVVHIHADGGHCVECSPNANEEIPLFPPPPAVADSAAGKKRKLDTPSAAGASDAALPRDPKKALAMLKRSLLSKPGSTAGPPSNSRTSQYVDRSARRRSLYPDHSPAATPGTDRSKYPSPSISAPTTPTPPTLASTPPAPLPSSNIGHRLLMKQGWQPGSALGDPAGESGGLIAPLDPPTTVGRAGLGAPVRASSSTPAAQDEDWKDAGKKRRWAELRNSGSIS